MSEGAPGRPGINSPCPTCSPFLPILIPSPVQDSSLFSARPPPPPPVYSGHGQMRLAERTDGYFDSIGGHEATMHSLATAACRPRSLPQPSVSSGGGGGPPSATPRGAARHHSPCRLSSLMPTQQLHATPLNGRRFDLSVYQEEMPRPRSRSSIEQRADSSHCMCASSHKPSVTIPLVL